MSEAFYRREGERIVPTGLGASFWDAGKQGGAPVCGVVAQLLDGIPAPAAMLPARLTIDLYGAVPMAPMTVRTRLLREGKRIQIAELELDTGGRTWARATMLRVRTEGAEDRIEPLTHPLPAEMQGERKVVGEAIRVAGSAEEPGPGAVWMRVIRPMIAGEPMNALACLAAAADWGTTVSPPARLAEWTYANLDVSLHLARMPRGELTTRMGDAQGMFGTAHQTVFLNRKQAD